eukprot:scaffold341115_cov35-Prasinocladus_malaysianus.AAC.1
MHLPRVFDILQALFGRSGPCLKPQNEIIAKIKHTLSQKSPVSDDEVCEMLKALAAEAPEYLQILPCKHRANETNIRVNRRVELGCLRKGLQQKANMASLPK